MCLLAILNRVLDDFPVLVAANREEFYDRQGTVPELWPGTPQFVAGRDPRAGGTWLGVSQHGVIVAVTNRPKPAPTQARSRGLLCRELLACPSADSARERAIEELSQRLYAGCNVLAMDAANAHVIHAGKTLEAHALAPGIHLLSRSDVDDWSDPRVTRALGLLGSNDQSPWADNSGGVMQSADSLSRWLRLLQNLCRDHGDEEHPAICLHAHDRGTVSSSIIALGSSGNGDCWLHAQGPPCRNSYVDYSYLMHGLVRLKGKRGEIPRSD